MGELERYGRNTFSVMMATILGSVVMAPLYGNDLATVAVLAVLFALPIAGLLPMLWALIALAIRWWKEWH